MLEALVIRRNAILACTACAIALAAAAWLLLGLLWAIAGIVAGYFLPMVVYGVGITYFTPSPATLIAEGRPEYALKLLQRHEASERRTAKAWPSQFAEVLAHSLLVKSDGLHALHHDEQALRSADEGVAIYRTLAADRPAKYSPHLACAIDTQSHRMASLGQLAEAINAIQISIRLFRNLAIT